MVGAMAQNPTAHAACDKEQIRRKACFPWPVWLRLRLAISITRFKIGAEPVFGAVFSAIF
jgi:hypothetical protein